MYKHPPITSKLPVMMHGADYNPDQWLHDPQVLEEDVRLMKLAGCNVMSVGIFAWSALEPEEGKFTFEWMDQLLDRLAANGIYVWLATPTGARPAWMSEKYPEVLRVASNRVRNLHGHRHNHCYSSPVYREKTTIMNTKLAERYAHHPAVLGWHISNEYGGSCHCPYCQEGFREWLKDKYGTLEALNRAWWTAFWSHTYSDWSQIESPAPHGEKAVHGHNLDWRRYVTERTIDFYKHEIAPLKAIRPDLPATTNMMEVMAFDGLNYPKFADVIDFVSWDAYPTWHEADADEDVAIKFAFNHDLFRSIKGKPFLLMESTPSLTNWQPVSKLKRPGMHKLSSIQAVAHGSDSVQYFQWRKSRGSSEKFHGAVVDHVGNEHTRVFQEVAELGQTLAQLKDVASTSTPAEAAILFDTENRWAVNDAQGPRNSGIHYERTILEHYGAMWRYGVPVDVISSDADFSRYKVIAAPMLYLCSQETGDKLERFVENGGTLVSTYWSGIVDEHDLCHLGGFPGPLRRTLGIWAEEIEGLYDHDRNGLVLNDDNELGLSGEYESHELCELVHAETARVLGVYRDDFYAGRPALTCNELGNGRAYYMATRLKQDFLDAFYQKVIDQASVQRVLETELPEGVSVQLRTDGEQDFVFVMNFSGHRVNVPLDEGAYTNVETSQAVGGSVELEANGVAVLVRPSRQK